MGLRSMSLGAVLVFGALLLAGCPSIQSVQTARTAGEGNFEGAFEPGLIGVSSGGESAFLPTLNVSARYGVTDKVDIGGRFGTSLLELHGKFMFTDPEQEDAVQAAFAPQLGGVAFGGGGGFGGYGWLTLPVLVDVPVKRHAFIFGPRAQVIMVGGGFTEGSGTGAVLNLGSSFGFSLRAGDKLRILPEFSAVVPAYAGIRTTDGGGGAFIGQGMLFTFNLGIVIGGR
ncbi:MAG: hypothetical protein EA397_16795 [Deltaproteobacteria bacterium]|nr:MAG: hypothetical protein EA397_16795 [Deltaproteobacteria bacterium]